MHQKHDVSEGDECDFFEQRCFQRVYRLLDQRRTVIERDNRDAFGQARADLLNTRLHPVDDLLRVGACPRHDDAADGFIGPFHQRRNTKCVANPNLADLVHIDRNATGCADHSLRDVIYRFDQPDASYDRPRAVRLEHVAADVLIAPAHRLHDIAERQVIGSEPVGIDVDLILLNVAADGCDLGDAGNCIQLITNEPVLDAAKVAERMTVALDRVPEHVAHARRIGAECGRGSFGQHARHEIQPLEDPRSRKVLLHVVFEDHVDHREAERGLRTHDAHARKALEVHGERVAHLIFHLTRTVTGPLREHDHLVVG